jgi:hypothetical protein
MTLSTHTIRRLVLALAAAVMATAIAASASPAQRVSTGEGQECRAIEGDPASVPNPGDGWRYRALGCSAA